MEKFIKEIGEVTFVASDYKGKKISFNLKELEEIEILLDLEDSVLKEFFFYDKNGLIEVDLSEEEIEKINLLNVSAELKAKINK